MTIPRALRALPLIAAMALGAGAPAAAATVTLDFEALSGGDPTTLSTVPWDFGAGVAVEDGAEVYSTLQGDSAMSLFFIDGNGRFGDYSEGNRAYAPKLVSFDIRSDVDALFYFREHQSASLALTAGQWVSVNFDTLVGPGFNCRLGCVGILEGSNGLIDNVVFEDNISVVPEPATWAMMIVGFGLVGGAVRRRSRGTRPARQRLA